MIVYLTHWFPSRDRTRALAYFFVATPIAQMISPKLSNLLLAIGTDETIGGVTVHHPEVWGLEGWQWVFIAWGIPAVVLGVAVLIYLTDKPARRGGSATTSARRWKPSCSGRRRRATRRGT